MNAYLMIPARYLFGRKLRTALTTLAVVFGVMVIFMVNLLLPTLITALSASNSTTTDQADLTISSVSGEAFGTDKLDVVRQSSGVAAVSPLFQRQLTLTGANAPQITLIGLDPTSAQVVRRYQVVSGRFLNPDDTNSVVLTQEAAQALGLAAGGSFQFPAPAGLVNMAVVGIISSDGVTQALAPLPTVQNIFGAGAQINAVDIALTAGADRDTVAQQLQQTLGAAFSVGRPNLNGAVLANLQLAFAVVNVFGFLALFMGGFLIFNTFRTVVVERRHDIGMLRAVGATRGVIVRLILIESLLQGILGTVIGLVLGYLIALGLVGLLQGLLDQFVKVRIAALTITPQSLFLAIALGILVTMVAGFMPALGSSKVPVLVALRDQEPEPEKRRIGRGAIAGVALVVLGLLLLLFGGSSLSILGAVLLLVALIVVAPLLLNPIARLIEPVMGWFFAREGLIAEGNLQRNPGRSAVTVSSLLVALAIIVGVGSMLTSLKAAFEGAVQQSLAADILLLPPSVGVWSGDVGVGPEFEQKLAAIPGVGLVAGLRYASSLVGAAPVQVLAFDPATYPQVSQLAFSSGSASDIAQLAQGRTALVNTIFATTKGVKVGDSVNLQTPDGAFPYRIAAIGSDYLGAKVNTVYISQANMAADFHKTEDVMVMANLAAGADSAQVRSQTQRLLSGYPQLTLYWGADYRASQLNLLEQAFFGLYVVLFALTIPSVLGMINTLAINVLERTREIAVLRAIGATRQQVRRIVIAESLLLAASGVALGLIGGLALGWGFTLLLANVYLSTMHFYFPFTWIIVAIVAAILIALLASVLPARQAARVRIVQALQYE